MLRSLVGSEMCIRDRGGTVLRETGHIGSGLKLLYSYNINSPDVPTSCNCLLYTSDAADDLLCVDLGGRRIFKKKNKQKKEK